MNSYEVDSAGTVWLVGKRSEWARPRLPMQKVDAENETEALRAVFAPNGEKFFAVRDSWTAHCCFEGSVMTFGDDGAEVVCETMEFADAEKIAAALNATQEKAP